VALMDMARARKNAVRSRSATIGRASWAPGALTTPCSDGGREPARAARMTSESRSWPGPFRDPRLGRAAGPCGMRRSAGDPGSCSPPVRAAAASRASNTDRRRRSRSVLSLR
jgi:hypothetical protein